MFSKKLKLFLLLFFWLCAYIAAPKYKTPEFYILQEWYVVFYISFMAAISMIYIRESEKDEDIL